MLSLHQQSTLEQQAQAQLQALNASYGSDKSDDSQASSAYIINAQHHQAPHGDHHDQSTASTSPSSHDLKPAVNGGAAGGGQRPPEHSANYLAELLKDKKQVQAFPGVFTHVERMLDDGKSHMSITERMHRQWAVCLWPRRSMFQHM